jgi:hypothetical protein
VKEKDYEHLYEQYRVQMANTNQNPLLQDLYEEQLENGDDRRRL